MEDTRATVAGPAPVEAPEPTTVRVLAIATDDTWAHVYDSVALMLNERNIGVEHRGGMEFFDGSGRRLAPVFSPTWELQDLALTGDESGPCELLQRLHAVVRHAESYIRRHPERVVRPGVPEAVLATFPRLSGRSLAEALETVWEATQPRQSHSAGFFHNALHAAGWNHE